MLLICSLSCEELLENTQSFKVQNNSNDTIRCFASYNYPDTTLPANKPVLQMVEPQDDTSIEDKELEYLSKKDTFLVFIISEETYDNNTWEVIKDQYIIIKRYNITGGDLQNGILYYP